MGNNKSLERMRSAGLLINVYPSGDEGLVKLSVESLGPVDLDPDEALEILRIAAEMMQDGRGAWLDPEAN